MKKIEILIVIVIFLVGLAFVFCCKDKAEAVNGDTWETAYPSFTLWERADDNDTITYIDPYYEPNEPLLKIEISEPNYAWYAWKCSCGEGFPEMFSIQCSCGKEYKTLEIIMKCIPTWPDYIELEKDLTYYIPDDNDGWTVGNGIEMIIFPKGTKIYFKED